MKTDQCFLFFHLSRLMTSIFFVVFAVSILTFRSQGLESVADPTLWIVDDVTNTVYEVLVTAGTPTVISSFPIPLSADSELAYDPANDTLWGVNEFFGRFHNFTTTGDDDGLPVLFLCDIRGDIIPPGENCTRGPEGIAVDFFDDTLWAVDDPPGPPVGDEQRVYNFTKDGTLVNSFLTSTFDVNSTSPQGIAADPFDDALWIVDNFTDLLYHITPDGTLLESFSTRNLTPQATNPQGVTVDGRDGSLWITDRGPTGSTPGGLYNVRITGAGNLEQLGFIASTSIDPLSLNLTGVTFNGGVVDDGGTVVLKATFDSDDEGFVYVDDAFRGAAEPDYADGSHSLSGGFTGGGLQVLVGNVDDDDILGMSGGWQQTFDLDSDQQVSIAFRYNLTQASDYESDEFSQALLTVDGDLVNIGGDDFLAEITGNGNGGPDQTTGWVHVCIDVGTLTAGTHTFTIGAFNNKKTLSNEVTEMLIDDLVVRSDVPPTTEIIIESDFDADEDGFTYADDTFRDTSEPDFADGTHVPGGGFSGGGLQVVVGDFAGSDDDDDDDDDDENNDNIFGMSGGWQETFVLDAPKQITVSFRYNLTQAANYESDEFSEVLVSVDDTLIGPDEDGSLVRITGNGNGGSEQTTGWVLAEVNFGILAADETHTLTIGAYNNKRTFHDEITEILIDDVVVTAMSPTVILQSDFDSGADGFIYEDDAFLGTDEPDYASGNHSTSGGFNGGGLQVVLGGIDNANIFDMSGGWTRTFTLDDPQEVFLLFRYNLTQAANYESDEFSEALVALDDTLIGPGADGELTRITGNGNGGSEQSTGWVSVSLDLGTLVGEHTVTIGAYNNKKTFDDESTEILIDDVSILAQ